MKNKHYYITLLVIVAFIVGALYGADRHRQRVYHKCVDTNKQIAYNILMDMCKEVAQ